MWGMMETQMKTSTDVAVSTLSEHMLQLQGSRTRCLRNKKTR